MAKRERALSSLREFRPEIRNACVKICPRFLHRMERAGGSHALGGGPDQNERFLVPWHRASRVAKTSAKRDDFLAAAKDAQSGADLDTVGEVFFKCLPHPAHSWPRSSIKSGSNFAMSRNLSSIAKLLWA